MTIREAISIGNQFLLDRYGLVGEPTSANLMKCIADKHLFWSLIYDGGLRYPDIPGAGAMMDGGDFFVTVADATGHVSLD